MTAMLPQQSVEKSPEIIYPTGDGQPVAETFDHLYAIFLTIELLRQYLQGQRATVLGNQFLYYAQGFPRLRVAPDVMVIFGVEPGGRDSYKIWEEGEIPRVIFEMTSPSTRDQDEGFKKGLYEQLAVEEYWQFDPKGEWIEEQLRGFRWLKGSYEPIADRISTALGLRLEVSDRLIAFYRLDTSEKLLIPEEVRDLWQAAEQRADQEHQRAERLAAQLRAAGIEPENGGA